MNNEDNGMVFIAHDRNKEQRKEHRKLIQQKQKRADNPKKTV